MTFERRSFNPVTEISPPQDVREVLRAFAKSARKAHNAESFYPRRNELKAMLADVRACIDRINASTV